MTDFSPILAFVSTLFLFFGQFILIGCKSKGAVPTGPSKDSLKDQSTVRAAEITKSVQKEVSVEHKIEGNPDPKKNNAAKKPSPGALPVIPEPTPSAKKKQEKLTEQDKKLKIQTGFYQAKSDEDDTLEPIKSLPLEKSDENSKSKKKDKN